MVWIDLLASIAPPLIGPLIVEFYIFRKRGLFQSNLEDQPTWKPAAFIAYFIGAGSTFFAPEWAAKALVGLLVSIVVYWGIAILKKSEENMVAST